MKQYHKINTVYKRDEKGRLIVGDWSCLEFAWLAGINWTATEKVDGTNIRVMWDGDTMSFGGKTDNAQIPPPLLQHLYDTFGTRSMHDNMKKQFSGPVCIYGEGFGPKIQKGGRYRDQADFIMFDVMIDGIWLSMSSMSEISSSLGIPLVPIVDGCDLPGIIERTKAGRLSQIADDRGLVSEGVVVRPCVRLLDSQGNRIITKIKTKDFERVVEK